MALDLSGICIRQWNIVTLSNKAPSSIGWSWRPYNNYQIFIRKCRAVAFGGGGDVEIIIHNSLARLLIDEDVGVCTLG